MKKTLFFFLGTPLLLWGCSSAPQETERASPENPKSSENMEMQINLAPPPDATPVPPPFPETEK